MQTKFVEANGLRFEVLEQGTGVRLALCLHGFPEHAISWRHQIPVLAGMRWSLTSAAGCLRLPLLKSGRPPIAAAVTFGYLSSQMVAKSWFT